MSRAQVTDFFGWDELWLQPAESPYPYQESEWVEETLARMSPEERIAQCIMVAAYPEQGPAQQKIVARLICEQKVGSVIFFQGGPADVARLANYYQSVSEVPLLMAIDAEWGLGMRLDSTISYPRQMMMGAIRDENLIYHYGQEVARQCRRIGLHINFAPVIDVNNNALNPVINSRSFGEEKERVARMGFAYMAGLQSKRVLATGKHFPGHGDTETDSHHALPLIKHSRQRLDSLELFPFRYNIANGMAGIMVAHLHIPALDTTAKLPTTLSGKVINGLLRDSMGFDGLIITDAMNMAGGSGYSSALESNIQALAAGNDILLMPSEVPATIEAVKEAIDEGLLSMEEIDMKCRRVLALKEWAGLTTYQPAEMDGIYNDLNNAQAHLLERQITAQAITLVSDKDSTLPLMGLDRHKTACLSLQSDGISPFQKQVKLYENLDMYSLKTGESYNKTLKTLSGYDRVIISLHSYSRSPSKKFGLNQKSIDFIEKLSAQTDVILCWFGSPYGLEHLKGTDKLAALCVSYNNSELSQELTAQALYGALPITGRLPVSAGGYQAGTGLLRENVIRLGYTDIPEEVGISHAWLDSIRPIVDEGIQAMAYPGCQILAARHGKVFYYQSFGHHTYQKKRHVDNMDLYDLASITKVMSTTLSLMTLYEDGLIKLEDRMAQHLTYLDTTNKKEMTLREVLTHQSGMAGWIAFYAETMKNGMPDPLVYNNVFDQEHSIQVADNMYIMASYRDSIYQTIAKVRNYPVKRYKYSDLGFYLFHEIIEDKTKTELSEYVNKTFYYPMGAWSMGYNPLKRHKRENIAPTENDQYFRHQLLQGHVHDYGAAMLGGVAGHAGLFSNANDLAKMSQMLLWNGQYGNEHFLDPATIALFTSCQYCPENRRGLGFDKPEGDTARISPTCENISLKSYGHTGFTGTIVWADPEQDLIYVFLSNRIHPDQRNSKLIKMDIRTRIQKVLYDAIEQYGE